jgi:peptide/nickel transport system permease protein
VRWYLASRLVQAIGVVFFATTLAFVLIHLAPGDPIGATLNAPNVTESVREHMREQFGLDRPIAVQYVRWVANVARGELGYSFSQHRPVRDVFADAFPRTLLLSGCAMLLSFGLGIWVALLQAEHANGARDRWFGRMLLLLYSVPDFWFALVVLMLFAYRLGLFPAGGLKDAISYDYLPPLQQLEDRLMHLALPVVTLSLLSAATVARYQRAALVNVLETDWMRTALAKGLGWRESIRRHAFRNALLPTITLVGLSLPAFAAGALFVESVFSWPGMGYITVTAIASRDYHLVTTGVLVLSIFVAAGALLADIAVAAADPRIRLR